MPTASRMERKLRRMKLERSRAMKIAEFALKQRDQARMIAGYLEAELKKKENPNFTMTKIDEAKDHEESVENAQELAARNEE